MNTVIEAIATLDDKLTVQIKGVTDGLAKLSDAHHSAIIEQERRNATFATALQLEQINAKLTAFLTEDGGRAERIRNLENKVAENSRQIAAIATGTAVHQLQGMSATLGWTIQALVVLCSTVLGFILYHAVFH